MADKNDLSLRSKTLILSPSLREFDYGIDTVDLID